MQLNQVATNKREQNWRIQATRNNLGLFTAIYLPHYVQNNTPKFHFDIFKVLADDSFGLVELIAFRGSAKSVIASVALPLWASVFNKRKFIILCSDTGTQAKTHISNIIREFERNELLIQDFGPFKTGEEWRATDVVLDNGVRILSRSKGNQVRGLRHYQNRPDLIICDDIENIESVRTKEQRDKTEEWLLSDVIPSIDPTIGRVVLIGNLIHSDSIMARMKKRITENNLGKVYEFPLINSKGENVWEERFTSAIIEDIQKKHGNKYYNREFLLKLVPEEGQVIESVQYYSERPNFKKIAIGVDLAISEKTSADYTAINAMGMTTDAKFFNILSTRGHWNFNTTLEKINAYYRQLKLQNSGIPIFLGVEDVAYQRSAIEELRRRYKLPVKAIKRDKDKRARLEAIEPYFTSEQVFFRENEDADVVSEILNFGIEEHDDLMDALEISLNLLITQPRPDIIWL